MKNTIQSDLIRGHINTIILKALFDGDRYGYDIVREIEQKSSGQYKLKEPTLYSCLKRLEIQGFIRSYWGAKSNGGRRKYFTLTEMGRELFIKNQNEWEYSRTVIDKLISDKEVDLRSYAPAPSDEAPTATAETESASEQSTEQAAATAEDLPEEMRENDPEENDTPSEPETQPNESESFSDTTHIMDELLRRQAETDSYTAKLIGEKYVSDHSGTEFSSQQYFKDFYDGSEDTENAFDPEPSNDTYENPPTQQQVEETEETYDPTPQSASAYAAAEDTQDFQQEPKTPQFLDYHTATVLPDPKSTLIEREYRNILGDFLNACFIEKTPRTPEKQSTPPAEDAPELPKETAEERPAREDAQDESAQPLTPYTPDADVNRKLNRLTGEVREMGNNVVIRTHNSDSSKQYSNAYYYYSNKLALVHYGILFGIMMLEILFSAVFVGLVAKAGRSTDKWFYIAAGVLAAAFPVAAFIRNITDPAKQKRVNFNIKNALIYRLIVMAQCLLIIYCLNIIAGMPLSFGKTYLSTLLLPALLCTNFPVSALLFNALFKSKRFAVEN